MYSIKDLLESHHSVGVKAAVQSVASATQSEETDETDERKEEKPNAFN